MPKPNFGDQRAQLARSATMYNENRPDPVFGREPKPVFRQKIRRTRYVLIVYKQVQIDKVARLGKAYGMRNFQNIPKRWGERLLEGESLSTVVRGWIKRGGPLNNDLQVSIVDDDGNISAVPSEQIAAIVKVLATNRSTPHASQADR